MSAHEFVRPIRQ